MIARGDISAMSREQVKALDGLLPARITVSDQIHVQYYSIPVVIMLNCFLSLSLQQVENLMKEAMAMILNGLRPGKIPVSRQIHNFGSLLMPWYMCIADSPTVLSLQSE